MVVSIFKDEGWKEIISQEPERPIQIKQGNVTIYVSGEGDKISLTYFNSHLTGAKLELRGSNKFDIT